MSEASSFVDDSIPPDLDSVRFRVGEWTADRMTLRLERERTAVAVEPKVMDLLTTLASAAPAVVSRETIIACLWPRVHVGEESLARCVSKLRTALGDDAREPRYIETIPKRGYRLIAPVTEVDGILTPGSGRTTIRWRTA